MTEHLSGSRALTCVCFPCHQETHVQICDKTHLPQKLMVNKAIASEGSVLLLILILEMRVT